ncbi:MAG: ATP-binding protein [Elusimicrobiota bacterium]
MKNIKKTVINILGSSGRGCSPCNPASSANMPNKRAKRREVNLKPNIVKIFFLGFISIIILITAIAVFGWYAAKKIGYIKDRVIAGYRLEKEILLCRREEKNIIIRGVSPEAIAQWRNSYVRIQDLIPEMKAKRYIGLAESRTLEKNLLTYGQLFLTFVKQIQGKKALNTEILNSYDEQLKKTGRLILETGEQIIQQSKTRARKITRSAFSLLIIISLLGIGFSLILGYRIIKTTRQSLKENEDLAKQLKQNNLELTLGLSELKQTQKELEEISLEMALELSEIFNILRRVAGGDLTAAPLRESKNELLTKLRVELNQTIGKIKQQREELKSYTEKLKESNTNLEDFAYVASHDLQEPLRKIKSFGDLLMLKYKDNIDSQGGDYIQRMQGAAIRMQKLIEDLLSYSRVTQKGQPFMAVDLNIVVKEALSDLEIRLRETNGRVEAGDLPVVNGDSLQLRRLFQNLLGNALKFHKKDQPPVIKVYKNDVQLAGADSSVKRFCLIVVEDNGIGFDEQYTNKIFEIFQRLHGRDEYEGTGVGLAICKKIVEWHGGAITAQSQPGEGTKFIVTLPMKQMAVDAG